MKTPRTPRKGTNSSSANSSIVTRSRSFRAAGSLSTTPNKLSSASVIFFISITNPSMFQEVTVNFARLDASRNVTA